MNLFILIFFSAFTYLNYLIGQYYVDALELHHLGAIFFWIIHVVANLIMIATPFVYRLYPIKKPPRLYSALQWGGYSIFGIYSILIVFMLLNISGFALFDYLFESSSVVKLFLKFSLALISLVIAFIVVFIGMYQTRKKPQIKKVKIPIANLPLEFEGFKILQMSDIHVGQTIRSSFVESLVEISNDLSPDVVVFTGDIIDGLHTQIEDELIAFKNIDAPYGKFMVLGNHEYYWGVNDWINHWGKLDFNLLLNQHQVIEKDGAKIVIAGVHDYSAHRVMRGKIKSSPKESLEGSPSDAIKILLAHQPRSIYEAHKAGFDLQLSGHTHSGQYFPYNILIYLFQPFVKGLNRYKTTWIYVNKGTGYWGPPTRFGAPPEITLIELRKNKM